MGNIVAIRQLLSLRRQREGKIEKANYTKIKDAANETEQCVRCGLDTGIGKNRNIADRRWYVEGAGQLCECCRKEIYY